MHITVYHMPDAAKTPGGALVPPNILACNVARQDAPDSPCRALGTDLTLVHSALF